MCLNPGTRIYHFSAWTMGYINYNPWYLAEIGQIIFANSAIHLPNVWWYNLEGLFIIIVHVQYVALLKQLPIACTCRLTPSLLPPHTHSNRRSSAHLDLPLRTGTRSSSRYEPYPSGRPMRELATPGALHLANTPILNIKRRLSKPGLPMWALVLLQPLIGNYSNWLWLL